MKVLWITNTLFPAVAQYLGQPIPVINGWLFALAKDLSKSNISLIVASASNVKSMEKVVADNITFYVLKTNKPITQYDTSLEPQWHQLVQSEKPDLVHIHGTEYAPGLALIKSNPELKYILSIQGLISVISRFYMAGLKNRDILKNLTIRDVLRRDTIFHARNKFETRGRLIEHSYIKNVPHIIGRTNWDHNHIKSINPRATYHFCNESLRDPFYSSKKWNLEKVNKHSIFISQAGYPIKGLHMVLAAAQLLVQLFPNLMIRVAGFDITQAKTAKDALRLSGYGKYLKKLIKKLNLIDHVKFTGPLSDIQMVEEYLKAHVFICPSSIENSPNSIGEAQLLGVPCIGSYVGGIPDMISQGNTGILYRFEEIEMLAAAVSKIFEDDSLASKLSGNGIEVATERHNREENTRRTLEIYNSMVNTSP